MATTIGSMAATLSLDSSTGVTKGVNTTLKEIKDQLTREQRIQLFAASF